MVCQHIYRQKGRNPSQGLAARIPSPGTNFQMPRNQVPITAFPHLWGLATATRIPPFPTGAAEKPRTGAGSGLRFGVWMRETWRPVASGAIALFPLQPLASHLVLLVFNIPLLSPGSVAECPPLTPAGPLGTLSALCRHVIHPGLCWFQLPPAPWGRSRSRVCTEQVDA